MSLFISSCVTIFDWGQKAEFQSEVGQQTRSLSYTLVRIPKLRPKQCSLRKPNNKSELRTQAHRQACARAGRVLKFYLQGERAGPRPKCGWDTSRLQQLPVRHKGLHRRTRLCDRPDSLGSLEAVGRVRHEEAAEQRQDDEEEDGRELQHDGVGRVRLLRPRVVPRVVKVVPVHATCSTRGQGQGPRFRHHV